MQLQLSFLETTLPEGTAPVWSRLDEVQRAEVVAVLARLMAKIAVRRETVVANSAEADDE